MPFNGRVKPGFPSHACSNCYAQLEDWLAGEAFSAQARAAVQEALQETSQIWAFLHMHAANDTPTLELETCLQDKLSPADAKAAIQSASQETCQTWSLWAVMLRWIHFAAGAVDAGQPSEFSVTSLACTA